MNRRALLLTLATSLALGGCLRPEFRTAQLDATGTGSIGARYTLAAGDKLRVIVFGQDNLSNIYAVDGAGRIAMPLIGPVAVGGQSTAQAARTIEARLTGGEPVVVVADAPPLSIPVSRRMLPAVRESLVRAREAGR